MGERAMDSLDPFAAEAIRLALVRMFRAGGHFSICTVDTCLKIANVDPPKREYEALHALHCVGWGEMTLAMRQEVVSRTLALLQLPPCDVAELGESLMPDTKPAIAKRNGLMRLLVGSGEADHG